MLEAGALGDEHDVPEAAIGRIDVTRYMGDGSADFHCSEDFQQAMFVLGKLKALILDGDAAGIRWREFDVQDERVRGYGQVIGRS